MTVEPAANRAGMLGPVGVSAIYSVAGGGSAEVVGIPDRAFVERGEAALTLAEDDLSAGTVAQAGDKVTLSGAI